MDLLDITQPLTNNMPVWPGDTSFSYKLKWSKEETGSVNVGQITMSTHCGTHIDAPYHFDTQGNKIHQLDLSLYMGKVKVIHLKGVKSLSPFLLEKYNLEGLKRIIIKTDSWPDKNVFPKTYTHVDPSLGPYLYDKGIRLLGLDSPSVDPIDSKELPAHHSLNKYGIHILEGCMLNEVKEGNYKLTALPLSIKNGDGSPVRAVLEKTDSI